MTKILYIITKSNWGGAQRYVFDLATSLPKKEFEVVAIVGGEGALKKKLEEKGVSVMTLPSLQRDINPLKDVRSFLDILRYLKNERPDIVHLNSSKIGVLGSLAARMAGVSKIIFTAHGWAFNEDRSLMSKALIYCLYWVTVLLSTQTITVSKATRQQISFFPFIQKKIAVIPNGIHEPLFFTKEEARAKLAQRLSSPIPHEATVIGAVGELHPIKGFRYLIESVALLSKKAPLVLIMGEGGERKPLESLIREQNAEKNVFLLGHVEDAERYLKALDLMIIPSLSEAFCYVAAEAGVAESPVIASAVGGIPEIVQTGKTGLLVAPREPEELAQAIDLLLKNPEAGREYASALAEKVRKEFLFDTETLPKTLALYRN